MCLAYLQPIPTHTPNPHSHISMTNTHTNEGKNKAMRKSKGFSAIYHGKQYSDFTAIFRERQSIGSQRLDLICLIMCTPITHNTM